MTGRATPNALYSACVAAVALAAGLAAAGEGGEGPSWPQFHGPARDNIAPERGLLRRWPAEGPRLVWTFSPCGGGYASVSVADALVFTSGDFGDREMVIALTLDGKEAWRAANGRAWRGPSPGSRATPTWQAGVVYHLSPTGRLAAWRAKSGEELWAVDLAERFAAKPPRWGLSENVVADGAAVLCAPGGDKGRIVALDKADGTLIWANTEVADRAAYCSPVVVTHEGVRQMITLMARSVVSVDVRTGKLLWSFPHRTDHEQNVTPPVYADGHVFVTSGHGAGGRLLKIAPGSRAVSQVWAAKDLDNCHGGVLLLGGRLYGSACKLSRKGFLCVDFADGKTLWSQRGMPKVSLAWADGMFYCLDERGNLSLVEADGQGCKVVSRFRLPSAGRKLSMAHPVVRGGRLYVRHWDSLFAYDVQAPAEPTVPPAPPAAGGAP